MELTKNINLKIFGIILCAFLLFYHSTLKTLFDFWTKDEFSHGFLLLAVSVYIFYRLVRERREFFVINISAFWGICLVMLIMLWLAARITFIEKLELISLPFILMAVVLTMLGYKNGRKFLLPFVLMLFATPIFELGNLFLQKATAFLSGAGLDMVGLQVLVDGILMQIPAGNFIVDTGCSGVRVLTVGTSLSLIFAYMNKLSIRGSIIVMMLGAGFSFLANIIRVMIIVYVGNVTNMQSHLVYDHADLGWIVFAVVIFIYFFLVGRLLPQIKQYKFGILMFLPESKHENLQTKCSSTSQSQSLISVIIILIAIGIGPGLEFLVHQKTNSHTYSLNLPQSAGLWKEISIHADNWKPDFQAGSPSHVASRNYSNGIAVINLTAYLFSHQSNGNEAINVNNRPYDKKVWSPVHIIDYQLSDKGGTLHQIEETRIRYKNTDKIVWRWYEVNGKRTGNAKLAKIYNLIGVLRGKPEITVVMLETSISTSLDMARLNLLNILELLPHKIDIK